MTTEFAVYCTGWFASACCLVTVIFWLAARAARRRRRKSLSSLQASGLPAAPNHRRRAHSSCQPLAHSTLHSSFTSSRRCHLLFFRLLHCRPLPAIHEALTSSFYPLSSPSPLSLDEKISRNPSRVSRLSTTPLLSLSPIPAEHCPRSPTQSLPFSPTCTRLTGRSG